MSIKCLYIRGNMSIAIGSIDVPYAPYHVLFEEALAASTLIKISKQPKTEIKIKKTITKKPLLCSVIQMHK